MPELLDFANDLVHLEAASKVCLLFMVASLSFHLLLYCSCLICFWKLQIELKTLAEEMQAATKGLEKVEQELMASENDGAISLGFRKVSYTWKCVLSLLIWVSGMCILINSLANDKNYKIFVAASSEIALCFQVLKEFLDIADEEVKTLASLYSEVVSYI